MNRLATNDHTGTTGSRADDTFIAVTVAHLCDVGRTGYDNPQALAAVYRSPLPYPGDPALQDQQLVA